MQREPDSESEPRAWHDIWNAMDEYNLPLMANITRRFSKFVDKQGVWSRDEVRRQKRRYSR